MTITEQLKRNTVGLEFEFESITTLDWLGAVFAVVTGAVHLYLYATTGVVLFLFAGLGFFGAVGLLLTTFSRRLLFALGIPFTGIQIVLWVTSGSNVRSRRLQQERSDSSRRTADRASAGGPGDRRSRRVQHMVG
jgi:hypothetical protein